MANPVEPLNFESIISYAIGDATLFIYIALIAFSIFAAKVRMPINAYLMMMFVFTLIMYFALGWELAIVVMIFVAIAVTFTIIRGFKQ